MKGTVVLAWVKTLEELYGKEQVASLLEELGWDQEQVITPTMDISDQQAQGLIEGMAARQGIEKSTLYQKMGRQNIWSFYEIFPSYFEQSTAKGFLMMMDEVHKQLTKMISGAHPPRLISEELSSNVIKIRYVSRRGLTDYFIGLIEGVGDFFEEQVDIEKVSTGETSEGEQYQEVIVTTEKGTLTEKKYLFSKILSAGFIRSLPVKIALGSSVIMTCLFLVFSGFQVTLELGLFFLLSFLAVNAISHVTVAPVKLFQEELIKIKNLDFSSYVSIQTGDDLENLMLDIQEGKEAIKKDLLFLKGGTDDLYKFVERFNFVAQEMKDLSEEISRMVQEVSEGAMHQAEETESSVSSLQENVDNIQYIAREEMSDKEALEQAVKNIRDSHEHITSVANKLTEVKQQFSEVDAQGKELSKNVEDMLHIVTTVEEIAEQTNLLALNAAIEAARAGEHGQGFAVVANEVRNLAENSGEAVGTISDNLKSFVTEVETLVRSITDQFSQLEESSQILQNTAGETGKATDRINEVAEKIADMVEKLSEETNNINKVFESINSLAGIAQENSAASEEMSSNVTEYSERIKEMGGYTEQLQTLAGEFKSELKKHTV